MSGLQVVQSESQGVSSSLEGLLAASVQIAPLNSVSALTSVPNFNLKSLSAKELPIQDDLNARDLQAAFELFSEMSSQLTDSYVQLENQVSELTSELTNLTNQRMQELAEKEQIANRLENLLSFLPGGVVVLDSTGRVSECNPAAIDLLDQPLEGELWRDVILRAFAPRQDDGHEVSLKDGRRISITTRNLGVNGQIILLTDQTETRRLQSELARHERLSALGKMMSALAHQIRTPLSAAMLYAGHLTDRDLAEEKRYQFAEKICNRLSNIERQVQDMLVFAKGELPLKDLISVKDLQLAIAEAMEVPLLTSNSHCLWRNECADNVIRCNRDALVGAILNLVNNAIQAVENHAQLHITFTRTQLKSTGEPVQLMIAVCDKGPGIPENVLPHVGELFVTTKSQGTGLGLAVVKAVARAHQGAFNLQSTIGQGTCASIYLPFAFK